jgi:hypothetical protein
VKRRIISVSMMPGQIALMRMFEAGVVEGGRLGEADEAVFGGGVCGLALEALDAGARRGVDDRAAAVLEHELDLVPHAHEGAAEVDRHEAIPLVLADLGGRLDRLLDARVVERDRRGALLVRRGKGGRRREVGMDTWGWGELQPLARAAS